MNRIHLGSLLLLALMLVGMLFETLGIGLIILVITLMMQGDLVANYPTILSTLIFLGISSQVELITAVMLGLVGVYFVKNLFLALGTNEFYFWRAG